MITFNIALSLFATVIMTLTIERVMRVFFEKRKTPLPVVILSYFLFWVSLSLQFWVESVIVVVVLYLFALTIITLNYKSVMAHRMFAVAGSYYVILASTAIYQFFVYILPVDLLINFVDVAFVSAILLSYFLVLLIFRHFKNIRKTTIKLQRVWLPFFFITITHAVSAIFHQLNLPFVVAIYNLTIALGTTFIIFYLYNKLSKAFEENIKSALHSQEKEYYYTQCQLMQETVESIKSIRHDMKFHLATVRDFTANNKANKATDYLNNLLGGIEKNEIYSNSKNIAFDSIINFKLNTAKQDNIKLDIRLLIPPAINIEVADIVTILGNLLDNALDAVSNINEKAIKLYIEYSKENLFIQVENTFDGVVKYSKDAKETDGDNGRILTRKSGSEHGHGLNNIRKSVEKYNGHIDINHDDNVFSVGVMLYVGDV